MRKKRYLVSVSGGRTSAMMAKLLKDKERLIREDVFLAGWYIYTKYVNEHSEYVFAFANTSREKEETLIFVDNIEKHFGIKIHWVEACVNKKKNSGTRHRITSFEKAFRNGEVFESVIAKYGIPNAVFLHCTRELKTAPIRSLMASIGWGTWEDYKTIIGYRRDEPKRATTEKAIALNQWYPLDEWGIRKPDVAYYWNRQQFDLGLIDADGNCKNCHKKSDAKILYQNATNPQDTVWIRDMQNEYSMFNGGRNNSACKPPYYFFRHNRTIDDIINQYPEISNNIEALTILVNDRSLKEFGADFDLHEQEDCGDSCEAFGELEKSA